MKRLGTLLYWLRHPELSLHVDYPSFRAVFLEHISHGVDTVKCLSAFRLLTHVVGSTGPILLSSLKTVSSVRATEFLELIRDTQWDDIRDILLECLFDRLDTLKLYDSIGGYTARFGIFLVKHDRIENALRFALQSRYNVNNGSMKEGNQLLKMYFKQYPVDSSLLTAFKSLLQLYLHVKKISDPWYEQFYVPE